MRQAETEGERKNQRWGPRNLSPCDWGPGRALVQDAGLGVAEATPPLLLLLSLSRLAQATQQ